jgi:hypothetical protein
MGDGLFDIFGCLEGNGNRILKLGSKQHTFNDLTLLMNNAFDKA